MSPTDFLPDTMAIVANSAGEGDEIKKALIDCRVQIVKREFFVAEANAAIKQAHYTDSIKYVLLLDGTLMPGPDWREMLGSLDFLTWAVSATESFDLLGGRAVAMEADKLYEIGALNIAVQSFGWEIPLGHAVYNFGGECMAEEDFPESVMGPYPNKDRDTAIGEMYYPMIKDMQTARGLVAS